MLLPLLDEPLSVYWRIEQSPCAINEVDWFESTPRSLSLNDTRHLRRRPSAHGRGEPQAR